VAAQLGWLPRLGGCGQKRKVTKNITFLCDTEELRACRVPVLGA